MQAFFKERMHPRLVKEKVQPRLVKEKVHPRLVIHGKINRVRQLSDIQYGGDSHLKIGMHLAYACLGYCRAIMITSVRLSTSDYIEAVLLYRGLSPKKTTILDTSYLFGLRGGTPFSFPLTRPRC